MGYGQSPWTFKGRALYQLQLVKADEARKYVPEELKLVEFFGYTLGGVYLARYDDSPAGAFEECVVMAGLVWNPPTSCAWAARVFVNNKEARDHGIASVGLPSRLAAFNSLTQSSNSSKNAWWHRPGTPKNTAATTSPTTTTPSSCSSSSSGEVVELRNIQPGRRGLPDRPVVLLQLPAVSAAAGGFSGPRMRLSLPSFSGGTQEYPSLLQYSCDLQTNVLPVAPMQVQLPSNTQCQQGERQQHNKQQQGRQQHHSNKHKQQQQQQQQQQHPEVLDLLLNGKPLMCLAFSDMVMKVEEPQRLQLPSTQPSAQHSMPTPAFAAMLPGSSSSGAAKH